MILIGLPGLYQNWLMAAADPTSSIQTHGDYNFFCSQSRFTWVIKNIYTEYPNADNQTVINMYVKQENIPWYLYNMFEKTYDIRVMVDNLVNDLLDKGEQFSVFNQFRDSLLKLDYSNVNEVIGLFYYYFSTQDHIFYKMLPYKQDNYINIEYDDFSDPAKLIDLLTDVPNFDVAHFSNMYEKLVATNSRYLNRKKNFVDRLLAHSELDIIETAYLGTVAKKLIGKNLDWQDPIVRRNIMKIKQKEIQDFAQSLC